MFETHFLVLTSVKNSQFQKLGWSTPEAPFTD